MTSTPPGQITRGFDVLLDRGTDLIFDPNPPAPDEDGDDEVVLAPYWDSVKLDIVGDPPNYNNGQPILNGYRFSLRYYELEDDFDNPGQFIKTFREWTLKSQTITKVSPSQWPFVTNVGDEIFPIPAPQTGTTIGQGGIKDGSQYGYLQVFDEAEISWLPRCSTLKQKPVEKALFQMGMENGNLPFPYYPMDTVNSVVTDEREEVTVSYRVSTVYTVQGSDVEYSHSVLIHQICTQDPEINEEKMKAILDKCYFTHGFYHNQLYDVDASPNYSDRGVPIGPVIEPEYKIDQAATDMVGFTVYELVNSVWDQNGHENQDQLETEGAQAVDAVKEETLAQVEQYTDIMADTELAYAAEVASIPARQQEYADIIKANEDKKTQLLRNTRVMMNLDPKMRIDIEAAFSNFEQPDFSRDAIPESGDD